MKEEEILEQISSTSTGNWFRGEYYPDGTNRHLNYYKLAAFLAKQQQEIEELKRAQQAMTAEERMALHNIIEKERNLQPLPNTHPK